MVQKGSEKRKKRRETREPPKSEVRLKTRKARGQRVEEKKNEDLARATVYGPKSSEQKQDQHPRLSPHKNTQRTICCYWMTEG